MAKSKGAAGTGFESDEDEMESEGEALQNVMVTYVCEDCDYKWRKAVRPELEDSYNDSRELRVDGFRVSCPICGSHEVQLDEG